MIALFISLKIMLVDTYALAFAPVMGETLVELVGGLLVGSGAYTTEEVSNMSWNECQSAINNGIALGTINPADVTGSVTLLNGDGSQTTVQANFLEYVDYLTNPETEVVASDLLLYGNPSEVLQDTVSSIFNMSETKANWVNGLKTSDVKNVRKVDMQGSNSMLIVRSSDFYDVYYGLDTSYVNYYNNGYYYIKYYKRESRWNNGDLISSKDKEGSSNISMNASVELYGDWVYWSDGSEAETEATEVAEVGETEDGATVTLDDIQSGAVSLDDTTLDYDSFNDEAIIDLLNQILSRLDDVPVVEDDNTLAEDFAAELDGSVAFELENINSLVLPTGIATVFPFCLPFDFAYGLELLASEPVAPKFEIPFEIPEFGLWPGTSNMIVLDFSEYDEHFKVGRWVQCTLFVIGLCFISFKLVKGVH